jgi:coenzyme F420-reducing hydrogenase delta subunit
MDQLNPRKVFPKVIVFACRYCPMIGAQEAGRARIALPENFRIIEVECASRVEPDTVIRAFSLGIDGVAVLACHLDGCRYNDANHRSARKMKLLATLLDTTGIDSRRFLTSYGTAHEAHQFAGLIDKFVNVLEELPCLKSGRPQQDSADGIDEPDETCGTQTCKAGQQV